jgi:hypothetical protein
VISGGSDRITQKNIRTVVRGRTIIAHRLVAEPSPTCRSGSLAGLLLTGLAPEC